MVGVVIDDGESLPGADKGARSDANKIQAKYVHGFSGCPWWKRKTRGREIHHFMNRVIRSDSVCLLTLEWFLTIRTGLITIQTNIDFAFVSCFYRPPQMAPSRFGLCARARAQTTTLYSLSVARARTRKQQPCILYRSRARARDQHQQQTITTKNVVFVSRACLQNPAK